MVLELKQKEHDNLNVLLSGKSNRHGKGIYTARPNQLKITPKQVIQVKQCIKAGMIVSNIVYETGLSEYKIRGVRNGRYDCLVDK